MNDSPRPAHPLINAHTHLYSGLAPLGIPAPEPAPTCFVEILERLWWRLDRALDADSLRASAELYVADALSFGVSGLVDHHESPGLIDGSLDVLADVCQELGMPAALCYGATERNGGRDEAEAGLAECARFIRDNDRPLVRGVVGIHAAFTVSDETLSAAAELARSLDTVLHIHVAEDRADVDDAIARGYAGLVDRLDQCDALIPGSIFAHGVHLTVDEVRKIEQMGIWLVHNPRSNRGNKVGYARALAASERVALGTDGYPADMTVEAAALREEAAAAGDDSPRVARRLAAGARLFAELFDGAPPAAGAPLRDDTRAAIRERAAAVAAPLWRRMQDLKK
ncbi:MAG: amidohydrolase family protein [Nannocystaceae bacterium]